LLIDSHVSLGSTVFTRISLRVTLGTTLATGRRVVPPVPICTTPVDGRGEVFLEASAAESKSEEIGGNGSPRGGSLLLGAAGCGTSTGRTGWPSLGSGGTVPPAGVIGLAGPWVLPVGATSMRERSGWGSGWTPGAGMNWLRSSFRGAAGAF
jgi:hypothetical protein